MDKILVLLIILLFSVSSAQAVLSGKIDYQIPIDYTKLNKAELETRADVYYKTAIQSTELTDDVTAALNLYTILSKKEPDNLEYLLRLARLYDNIGKNRIAKGNYYHALGISPNNPEPFFSLAEYYHKREFYKKALRFYKIAYEKGYSSHYKTLYRMGCIYQKFGDTKNAIMYLEKASSIRVSEDLTKQIEDVKSLDSLNKEYYKY